MGKLFRFVLLPLILLLLIAFGYFWVMWHWTFSDGIRSGYLLKMSEKGWLCKTWEGELQLIAQPGTVAEKFAFTVHDEKVAHDINKVAGQRVLLHYEQRRHLYFSCFGETEYFVSSIELAPAQ